MIGQDRQILDALLDIFAERGCFATSLDTVAATAGIGKGSLYRRFDSREALCGAALDHGARRLATHCQQVWESAPGMPPASRVLAVITELLALDAHADPLSPNALLRLSCSNRWTSRGQTPDGVADAFVPLVLQWQAAGVYDSREDPHWIVGVLLGLVSAMPRTAGEDTAARERTAARLAALLQRAFAPA